MRTLVEVSTPERKISFMRNEVEHQVFFVRVRQAHGSLASTIVDTCSFVREAVPVIKSRFSRYG